MEKICDKSDKIEKVQKKLRQFNIYLDYVKRYNILKLNWVIQKHYSIELNNIWQDMTIKLNGCGGPVRDASHWKKVFTEWKSHTRRKLKYNRPLNEIEKELVDLTGLTSAPERQRKLEKLPKHQNTTESNKPKVNKENERNLPKGNIIIKEEILGEWNDTSSNCFMEESIIERGSDKLYSKNKQKIGSQEKQEVNIIKIPAGENQSRDDNGRSKNIVQKDARRNTTDAAVQVNQPNLSEVLGSADTGLGGLSNALFSLSKAINRYCDIVERRIF